jgi:hypothetical protein
MFGLTTKVSATDFKISQRKAHIVDIQKLTACRVDIPAQARRANQLLGYGFQCSML